MPPTTFVDQSGPTPGTALSASALNSLAVAGTSEASTMDALDAASTWINHLNRLRNQLGIVIGGVGSAWNAAVQMVPLSQKGAASGVAPLTAQKVLDLSSAGTPTVAGAGAQGTGASIGLAGGSTDARGVVTMTTGTGTSAGAYWTLTFSGALTRTPVVLLSYTGPNTSSAPVAASVSTTGFTMVNATMAAATAFNVAYLVLE